VLKFNDSFKSILTILIASCLPIALPIALTCALTGSAFADAGFNQAPSAGSIDTRDSYTVVSKAPLRLESVSTTSLCGRPMTSPEQRLCLGEALNQVDANDTVSRLQRFLLTETHSCAVDERGVRCWKTSGRYQRPIQEILASGDNSMVRSSGGLVCLPQKDKTIVCQNSEQGEWIAENQPDGTTKNIFIKKIPANTVFGPFKDLRDFHIIDSSLCALDGEEVICQGNQELRFTPPTRKFPGAKGLSVSYDTVCVLYSEGLSCTKGTKDNLVEFKIGDRWQSAKTVFPSGYDSICAVDDKEAPMCVNLGEKSSDITDVTPVRLKSPDVKVVKFMTSGQRKCALIEKDSAPRSLVCGTSDLEPIPNTSELTDFSMTEYGTCGVDKKGLVSCFYNTVHMPSPLPEDGSKSSTLGLCRWNDSRFHCANLDAATDFSDIKKVISSTAISDTPHYPCLIYENQSAVRSLRCFGGAYQLMEEAPPLSNDDLKLAAGNSTACLYGGDATKCWGSLIGNAEVPNLSSPKKISFGDDYACAIDQFGFVCWGHKMEERELNVPANMGDLDFVVDFSLGDNHVCAITRESRLTCWGQNDEGQLNYPPVTNPVSIVSSGDTNCVSSDEGVTCWGARSDALVKSAHD